MLTINSKYVRLRRYKQRIEQECLRLGELAVDVDGAGMMSAATSELSGLLRAVRPVRDVAGSLDVLAFAASMRSAPLAGDRFRKCKDRWTLAASTRWGHRPAG